MPRSHRSTRLAAVTILAAGITISSSGVASAAPAPPAVSATQAGYAATWLAGKLDQGAVRNPDHTANLTGTANSVLALAGAGKSRQKVLLAMSFLRHRVNTFVKDSARNDQPGQLSLLILDAVATGQNPRSFGGFDLVTRLTRTHRTSGVDAGLFGKADPTYDGAYRQGLALTALAAVGRHDAAGVSWLKRQRCTDGGWQAYVSPGVHHCDSPATYVGPDTNSTAMAVMGLRAQGEPVTRAAAWFTKHELSTGAWAYYIDGASTTADPNSTALVIDALVSLGADPVSTTFTRHHKTTYQVLGSFQIGCAGAAKDRGAYSFTASPKTANLFATDQAILGALGKPLPLTAARWSTAGLPTQAC